MFRPQIQKTKVLVIIAIFNIFIPNALRPPSAKSNACKITTIDTHNIPRDGPSTITANVPPNRCPLVPAAIGKLIICRTKIKADIIPAIAISLSARNLFAAFVAVQIELILISPATADTGALIKPSGTCINLFYKLFILLQ